VAVPPAVVAVPAPVVAEPAAVVVATAVVAAPGAVVADGAVVVVVLELPQAAAVKPKTVVIASALSILLLFRIAPPCVVCRGDVPETDESVSPRCVPDRRILACTELCHDQSGP
jgi:hypothetical protein